MVSWDGILSVIPGVITMLDGSGTMEFAIHVEVARDVHLAPYSVVPTNFLIIYTYRTFCSGKYYVISYTLFIIFWHVTILIDPGFIDGLATRF